MTDAVARLTTALADRYAIIRPLGAGGMATVYLAQDRRHDRLVALKVLRPELAAILGGDRFLKEIRTTANLQHPHILPLHDSGEAAGQVFYVMPYVEGESLRDRLNRERQLPVDEAVRLAREVASALDYAHRHGVVHRDIKPENILLHEGQALVADFGIALAASRSDGATRLTETGMSLGTPQYMAPEQAMGEREITPKADVYALGCVTYEMLAGEPPFSGPTAQAIVARVMTETPRSLTLQRRTVPAHVESAVMTALEKLPADRFATAAQFAEALGAPSWTSGASPLPARRAGRRWIIPGLVAAGAALLATGWLIGLVTRDEPPPSPAFRVSLRIPSDHRLTGIPVLGLALSPDGRTVVYSGESQQGLQLYARRLDELMPSPIAGTQGGYNPLFSSDGRSLAFTNGVQLRRVGLSGGAPLTVPSLPGVGFFAFHWAAPDAFVASGPGGELGRLRPDGTFEVIARADSTRGEIALVPVTLLPDGAILAIAFSQGTAGPLFAVDGRTGARTPVSETVVSGAIYHDGVLAWVLPSGQLVATPFDLRRKTTSGTSVTLAENVRVLPGALPQIVASPSGDLAYVPSQPSDVVRVDRSGRLEVLTPQPGRYHNPRVSPDGRRIAVDNSGQTRDIWLLDLADRTMSRLSFENDGHDPMWMPDGRTVLYAHSSGTAIGIFRRRADGTGAAESLLVHGLQLTAHTASPGGDQLIAAGFGANGTFDLFAVNLEGERQASPVLVTPFNDAYPALSPDGRWLAYASDESGRSEVYVRPFPGGGAKVLVSVNGGIEPVWSRNGRELYYRDGEPRLVAAAVGPGPEFRVTGREPLFEVADYETSTPHANYDVTPDGRFILVRQGRLSEIVYIQNWTALVRRENPAR